MFGYDSNQKLIEIFTTVLRSSDVELRDNVITFLAMTEIPGAADMLERHLASEEIDWLAEYGENVLEHLRRTEAGLSSIPPPPPARSSTPATSRRARGSLTSVTGAAWR